MTLSPRVHNKETTSASSKDLKKLESEEVQGEQAEGKEKRKLETIRPAPEKPQSKAEPAAKTPVSEHLDTLPRAPGLAQPGPLLTLEGGSATASHTVDSD